MITEIKKGDRFRCVSSLAMDSDIDGFYFIKGKEYTSFCHSKIRNEKHGHHSFTLDVVNKHFEKIETPSYITITKIKKGDRFRCTQNYLTEDGQSYCYYSGREYLSERDGSITDIQKNKYHEWSLQNVNEYFQLMPDADVEQDLTREAIEQDEAEKSTTEVYMANDPFSNPVILPTNGGQIDWNNKEVNPATGRRYDDPSEIEWAKKWHKNPIINKIKEEGFHIGKDRSTKPADSRQFDTGSKRDNDDNKPLVNHIDPYTRLRFGHLLRAGAKKYGISNWRLGQPTETALESLHRHLAKFELNLKNGIEQDEDHIMSCIFNLQLIAMNEEKEGITVDHFYKKK